MSPGEEFRIYMKAADRNQGDQSDQHLSEATAIAYYRDELSAAEREVTQAHLVACAACIALLRSVSDFLEPASSEEEDVTDEETNEQWQSFLQRVKSATPEGLEKTQPVVRGDFKPARGKKSFMDSRFTLAMAASLLIAVGGVGWLGWGYWQERQSRRQFQLVAAELERKQQELERRLAQLSESGAEQIKREREQRLAAEAERDKLQDLIAATPQREDYARDYQFILSSERGSAEELQLKLNIGANVRLLISRPGAFSQYEVDLLDESGRSVRKFRSLRPKGLDQGLNFRLNRGALSPGKYRLRLLGRQGSTSTLVGEYPVLVTGPA